MQTKSTMKELYIRFLILIFFLAKSGLSFGSHGIGAEITYECLGGNNYKIKLKIIRDCSGIALASTLPVIITNSCGLTNPVLTVSRIGNPIDLVLTCNPGLSTCNGGFVLGMQIHDYEGTVNLPGDCQDWTFSHTINSRADPITTLVNTGIDSLFIYSVLNNTNSVCNNSIAFSNIPVGVNYPNYSTCYGHGAYDIDGDSISFQIIAPMTGPLPGDTVVYNSGYSSVSPVQSSTPITFDTSDGGLCFTPTQQEVSVFAVIASEFKNGILVGQVVRDFQLRIEPDPNPSSFPVLTGIDGTNTFQLSVCSGTPVNFFIAASDSETTENLFMSWSDSIPGSNFLNDNAVVSNYDTAFFSWTPTNADVSITPHCFKVSAFDTHCPISGIDTQSFCIRVYPPFDPFCMNPSIDENVIEKTIRLFPNPANDKIQLTFESGTTKALSCMIYDAYGRKIFSISSISNDYQIDVASWAQGIYHVILSDGERTYFRRLIVY